MGRADAPVCDGGSGEEWACGMRMGAADGEKRRCCLLWIPDVRYGGGLMHRVLTIDSLPPARCILCDFSCFFSCVCLPATLSSPPRP